MLSHQQTIEEGDEERTSSQEETTNEKQRRVVKTVASWWPVFIKILELSLCILCISLIVSPIRYSTVGTKYVYQLLLIFGTYVGFMITTAIFLLARLFGDRLSYKLNVIYSIVASFLNLTTGCLILIDRIEFSRKYIFYPNMYMLDMMCTSGVFAIVNMFVFATDAILTIRFRHEYM